MFHCVISADIFGIWFYDKDECARIGQLMNSLVGSLDNIVII